MNKIILLFIFIAAFCSVSFAYIPKDPDFICAEYHMPYTYDEENENYLFGKWIFDEQFAFFGFPASQGKLTARYWNKGQFGKPQVSGSAIDLAWDIEKGDPSVVMAIIDTGVRWENDDIIERLFINKGELPPPDENQPEKWDINGDGIFNVMDYKIHFFTGNKLTKDPNGNGLLDPQDLILTFSDGNDDDKNGFTDDICGWDFFEDDNDPEDRSSYATAQFHGRGLMANAGGQQDKAKQQVAPKGECGVCPECMILPLKDWDSFIVDTNYFGAATYYAQMVGASVIQGAVAGLFNSGTCKDSFKYVYDKGLPIFITSSDINSANHSYPTYLDEPVYCSGVVPDTYPVSYIPPTTYFRDSNLTQYGAKNHISFEVASGSESAAMSAGAAGLILSFGKKNGMDLHPDQVKQLLTLTCEDVLPANLGIIGTPDPAKEGWDQHFGYGRVNVQAALKKMVQEKIPPVARIITPKWFYLFNSESQAMVVKGDVLPYKKGTVTWVLEIGYGIEPADFRELATGSQTGENITLATVDMDAIKAIFPKGFNFSYCPNKPENKPYGDEFVQPNRFMFTLRLRVVDDRIDTYAEDRRTCYLHDDETLYEGWPKYIGVGGEATVVFSDLDGDNLKEVIVPTSDGRILLYTHDGKDYTYGGNKVSMQADYSHLAENHGFVEKGLGFRQSFTSVAVGDLDRDGVKEIVGAAGIKLYCFTATGEIKFKPIDFSDNFFQDVAEGRVDFDNHIGPGASASPVLHDLDNDGDLEILLGAFDQRVYAWHHDGSPVDGWPVYVRHKKNGGKIIHPPCVADLNGDGQYEVIVTTNEIHLDSSSKQERSDFPPMGSYLQAKKIPPKIMPFALDLANKLGGKNCMVYAIHANGTLHDDDSDGAGGREIDEDAFVTGWPVKIRALLPDLLPQIIPSNKPCAFDYNGDGTDEVVASFSFAKTTIIDGDGKILKEMDQAPFGEKAVGINDRSLAINFADSPAVGDITGDGRPEIAKGGITLLGVLNIGIAGQNFPFNHVVQVWDTKTGEYLDFFPRSIDDHMIYSDPAIADVSGDGVPEVISGTGMYLLHAFGENGQDSDYFPKFTGGWIEMTASVADIDNNGFNEMAAITREGWIFVWKTPGVPSTLSDWPTSCHDNYNSSNASVDAVPPAAVTDIAYEEGHISFKCPGDDGFFGKASTLEVYTLDRPIDSDNFQNATLVTDLIPAEGGEIMTLEIAPESEYILIVATDEAGNKSQIPLQSNAESAFNIAAMHEPYPVPSEMKNLGMFGDSSGSCFIQLLSNDWLKNVHTL